MFSFRTEAPLVHVQIFLHSSKQDMELPERWKCRTASRWQWQRVFCLRLWKACLSYKTTQDVLASGNADSGKPLKLLLGFLLRAKYIGFWLWEQLLSKDLSFVIICWNRFFFSGFSIMLYGCGHRRRERKTVCMCAQPFFILISLIVM